ncbi:hypothetical protein GN277_18210 [Lachnospiraceae bacterium WCA-9-b2]|uniref:DUF4352 domain-containing protein n=1 Tax=Sporofaciens musculi TaxID=2681861 RepID=A0A7X3MJ46_9FIRM|nr:hypothetical protein [Sporofaciens musculi]MXP77240.1 hypothetical protein [Sporofaciens musculi]
MKRVLSMLLAACLCCGLLAGCGGNSETEEKQKKKEKTKEYIEESQIAELFTNPDSFKGKYVVLTGQIFVEPEKSEGTTALQAWHDPQNAQNNFIIHYSGSESFSTNNYIKVDGRIEGTFEGENMMGGIVTAPLIKADKIEVMSYIEAVTPTIKELTPENAISEQNGISLKVDKIEFAENETRIYMTETNSSVDKFCMSTYSMKIIQNGQQIEQDMASISSFEGAYAELASDILPNASSSGIIVFPVIDSSASFQIYAEGFSDNWELEFAPFTIDIAAQ